MAKKTEHIATVDEVERLIDQSDRLRKLTKAPAMKTLSPKRYDKLVRQLEKVDRSIAKITKIVSK
jgi:hypothetical protein